MAEQASPPKSTRPAGRPYPRPLDPRRAGGARRALRRRRHRLLGREPHRHLRDSATSSSPRWPPTSSRRTIAPASAARSATPSRASSTTSSATSRAPRNLILYVSNTYQRPITTFVGADNCVQCHPNDADREGPRRRQHPRQPHGSARGRLPVPHLPRQHLASRHAARGGARLPEQDVHLRALPRRQAAARRLRICHIGGVPADAPKVAMPLHMTPGQCTGATSRRSSAPSATTACEMPHPERWNKEPRPAWSSTAARASACRATSRKTPSSASTATASQMPHPGSWRSSHGGFALKDNHERSASSATARTAASSATACRCRIPPAGCRTHPSTR